MRGVLPHVFAVAEQSQVSQPHRDSTSASPVTQTGPLGHERSAGCSRAIPGWSCARGGCPAPSWPQHRLQHGTARCAGQSRAGVPSLDAELTAPSPAAGGPSSRVRSDRLPSRGRRDDLCPEQRDTAERTAPSLGRWHGQVRGSRAPPPRGTHASRVTRGCTQGSGNQPGLRGTGVTGGGLGLPGGSVAPGSRVREAQLVQPAGSQLGEPFPLGRGTPVEARGLVLRPLGPRTQRRQGDVEVLGLTP